MYVPRISLSDREVSRAPKHTQSLRLLRSAHIQVCQDCVPFAACYGDIYESRLSGFPPPRFCCGNRFPLHPACSAFRFQDLSTDIFVLFFLIMAIVIHVIPLSSPDGPDGVGKTIVSNSTKSKGIPLFLLLLPCGYSVCPFFFAAALRLPRMVRLSTGISGPS